MAGVRTTTQLHRALKPLMDSAVHATAMLVLHICTDLELSEPELKRYTEILKLLKEAADGVPSTIR